MSKRCIDDYLHNEQISVSEYLRQVLNDFGISQYELCKGARIHMSSVARLYWGDSRVTANTALRLEAYLGIPAEVWLYLQMCEDIRASKNKYSNDLKRIVPYKKKVKCGKS